MAWRRGRVEQFGAIIEPAFDGTWLAFRINTGDDESSCPLVLGFGVAHLGLFGGFDVGLDFLRLRSRAAFAFFFELSNTQQDTGARQVSAWAFCLRDRFFFL